MNPLLDNFSLLTSSKEICFLYHSFVVRDDIKLESFKG